MRHLRGQGFWLDWPGWYDSTVGRKEVHLPPEVRFTAATPTASSTLLPLYKQKLENQSAHSRIHNRADNGDVIVLFVDLIDFYTHGRNKS